LQAWERDMADEIRVEYDKLADIAQHFAQTQDKIIKLQMRLEQQIDELRANGWHGQGATAFYAEMDELVLPSLKRTSDAMLTASDVVQTISSEFSSAEEDARNSLDSRFQGDPTVANPIGYIDSSTLPGGITQPIGKVDPSGILGERDGGSKYNHSNNVNEIVDGTRTGDDHRTADIFYVNGILNDPSDHLGTMDTINDEFKGKRVAGIYNQTEGIKADLHQAAGDRWGIKQNNEAVNSLKEAIKDRLENPGSFEIFAHSQGSAITAEALRQLASDPSVDLSRLHVVSMGGAGIDFPDNVSVENFVHIGDPVGMSSVIEDPSLIQHTTVIPNIEGLNPHDGSDYIRNINNFRAVDEFGDRVVETVTDVATGIQDGIEQGVDIAKDGVDFMVDTGIRLFEEIF